MEKNIFNTLKFMWEILNIFRTYWKVSKNYREVFTGITKYWYILTRIQNLAVFSLLYFVYILREFEWAKKMKLFQKFEQKLAKFEENS